MRPTIKIKQQNNFIIAGNAMKVEGSQIPGSGPIFVRQAIDIATDVENAWPLNERMKENTNSVTEQRKKKLNTRPTIFIGTEIPLTLMLVIILGCMTLSVSTLASLNKIIMRIAFKPPVTEPMQPPTTASRYRINLV